jgi:hypothetical protein
MAPSPRTNNNSRKLFPNRMISKQHVFLNIKKESFSIFMNKHGNALPQIVTRRNTANPVQFIT